MIFGVDMSSSVHVDNKGKEILILGKGPTQRLGENSLTAEKKCIQSILLIIEKNIVWACIIIKQTVIYLLMVQKLLNLKQKILRLFRLHYVYETIQKTGQQII